MAAAGRAPAASASYRSCLPVHPLCGAVLIQTGAVLATVKDAARRASAVAFGHPCPRLRADALGSSGRDEETALFGRTKKHPRWDEPSPPARVRKPQPMPNCEEAV